ncbi:LuxR C-terminal-related transcriptional regulator [Pseudaeromonas paramecii]|uniref:HTH luxR-type domain-containing protein n=1 Tax=Pseudaeromonas paramecii TaxID=2138166 RepID=A0ABP8QFM7_9GAMM
MSPHLSTLQQALQQADLLWLALPAGYDQQALCQELIRRRPCRIWPAPAATDHLWLVPDLQALDEPAQETLLNALLTGLPSGAQTLVCANLHSPLEGRLRGAGLTPLRLGTARLAWGEAQLADWWAHESIPVERAAPWRSRLGHWPLAWRLWQQACQCDEPTEGLLQAWGLALLDPVLAQLPAPLPLALALQAHTPVLDHARLLQLANLSPGQWRVWRAQLCQAGWLLPQEDGDHWQPWIAELLGLWREQPELDWAPLSRWLAQWPLADIQALYPAQPLPQLALSLFSRIGLPCLELGQGAWLAEQLDRLPALWLRQQPALCLLQAWLTMELHRRSDLAEEYLQILQHQSLQPEEEASARLLHAMISFNFDHLQDAQQQLAELGEQLPKPLLAPYRLTQAMALLFCGQLTRARSQLDLLVSWADCQQQYHLKLAAWYRLAQLHYLQGDWQLAGRVIQTALEFVQQQDLKQDRLLDSFYRLQAEICLQRGEPDQADYWLGQGSALAAPLGDYWRLPYLAHQALCLIWRGPPQALADCLEQLEQQRFGQQYCRMWQFRVGYALALGYQQRGDQAALARLRQRTPWHEQLADLYDLQDNLLHAWLAQALDSPLPQPQLQWLIDTAERWQAHWLGQQARLLILLGQGTADPELWHPRLAWLAGRQTILPLLLAGPRVVAPLQGLSRWPQTSPSVLALVQQALDRLTQPLDSDSELPQGEELSQRQWQILRLIAQGLSNEQMARQLFVAPSTIKTHINHLYAKLGVRTRAEAQAVARQRLLGG